MKKFIMCLGVVALVVGCSSSDNYYRGGSYDAGYATGYLGSGTGAAAMGVTTGETNGPGMHSEVPTGITGPGTAGNTSPTNTWTGGTTP